MGRKSVVAVAAIAAIAAVGIIIAIMQSTNQPHSGDGGTVVSNYTDPLPIETINVMSARSAFPFVQRWISEYGIAEDGLGRVLVSYYLYEPEIPSQLLIIGDNTLATNGSLTLPISPQAVAVVYNIPSFPDVPSGMKLNQSLLLSILNGTVTRWDDEAIAGLNEDLNLPAERIIVVRDSRNNSNLALLERYVSSDIKWPENSISVIGPDELAATVRKTPYSIGYVDFSYATQTRMTFAAVKNPNGEYIIPSIDSIAHAVNNTLRIQNITNGTQSAALASLSVNHSMLQNSSYPLTGFYYASLPSHISDAAKNSNPCFS